MAVARRNPDGSGDPAPEGTDIEQVNEALEGKDPGAAPLAGKTGDEAADPAAERNSGGTETPSGKAGWDQGTTTPELSKATAPTADPALKPNKHESIPTHTIGLGDIDATANYGGLAHGDEVVVGQSVDYFAAENALDLDDPVATQIAHAQAVGIAVGEGRRVDPRTLSGDGYIPNVADDGALSKLKTGQKFYALWLFSPGTDSIRWRNEKLPELLSGRLTRNGLPKSYWKDHSLSRPPLCERTERGYKLLDVDEPVKQEEAAE